MISISSRLMFCVPVVESGPVAFNLHLHAEGTDEGRTVYRYVVECRHSLGTVEYEGTDLRSGVGAGIDYPETFRTLVSFLEADAERYCHDTTARDDGDEGYIFSRAVASLAHDYADDLSMLSLELADTYGLDA